MQDKPNYIPGNFNNKDNVNRVFARLINFVLFLIIQSITPYWTLLGVKYPKISLSLRLKHKINSATESSSSL